MAVPHQIRRQQRTNTGMAFICLVLVILLTFAGALIALTAWNVSHPQQVSNPQPIEWTLEPAQ